MEINQLYRVILERKKTRPRNSRTARLFKDGIEKISKKVGEESVEVIVAALGESPERLASETADLLYHVFVLLAARGVPLSLVKKELEKRRK